MDIQYEHNGSGDRAAHYGGQDGEKDTEKAYGVPLADTFFKNDRSFRVKQSVQSDVAVIPCHDENGHCLSARRECNLFNYELCYGGGQLFPDNL